MKTSKLGLKIFLLYVICLPNVFLCTFSNHDSANVYSDDQAVSYLKYDLATQKESIGHFSSDFHSDMPQTSSLLDNLTFDIPSASNIWGADDRTRVTPTTSFPWSAICKIYVRFDSDWYIGSGAMIDDDRVLTAAHVIYMIAGKGWADEVLVVPGQDDGDPIGFGYSEADELYALLGWAMGEHFENDIAVIKLREKLGKQTGTFKLLELGKNSATYYGNINTAGYPGDIDDGDNMYFTSEIGQYTDEYFHGYFLDIAGGQSGSPVWVFDGSNRYIISVIAYGSDVINFGPRLNEKNYDAIKEWLKDEPEEEPEEDYTLLISITITILVIAGVGIVVVLMIRKKNRG